jgi:integral membrane protein
MKDLLKNNLGRLRIIAFLEGASLLILVFIAVPMKYLYENGIVSEMVGPVHGVLFIVYVLLTFAVASEHNWKFFKTTWIVLLASFIPFGTFWVDAKIFKKA